MAFPATPILDSLERSVAENPLSDSGKWTVLPWASSAGECHASNAGYGPNATPSGVYWNPREFTGPGVRVKFSVVAANHAVRLWACMSPAAHSGYALKVEQGPGGKWRFGLERWQAGVATTLLSTTEVAAEAPDEIGISVYNGQVTAYLFVEGESAIVGSAADSTFSGGFVGMEATVSTWRLLNFAAGAQGIVSPPVAATPVSIAAVTNPFRYYAFDLLSGRYMGQIPLRGVKFSKELNSVGTLEGTIDLEDERVRKTNPLRSTVPGRTCIVVDYNGAIVWAGIPLPRKWSVQGSPQTTSRILTVSCKELWGYFQGRVQATDYSAPPTSGIESRMSLWIATPWDASLIGCQIIEDAIGFANSASMPYGNLLGGLGVLLDGATPSSTKPAAPSVDWIAVTYPRSSAQLVDSIITQLSQLGLGAGFDFAVDVAYSAGAPSPPTATVNLSYPRRGRTFAENALMVDLTTSRGYEFPEDGTQMANTLWEIGGQGAIVVDQNIVPLEQGYPIWERVINHGNAQSQHILAILAQFGLSDLAMFSYPVVTPTVKLGVFDSVLPFGSFLVGDNVRLYMPALAPDGRIFDARFPAGLDQEWRIVGWTVEVADEGDAVLELNLAQPPALEALAPAV